MKKILTFIVLFLIVLSNNIVNVFASDNSINGLTEVSPYYIVTSDGKAFGTIPSIINKKNLPISDFQNTGCSEITSQTERERLGVPYGAIGLKCSWRNDEGKPLASILKNVQVANMVGFNGNVFLDSSNSRFYLVKHKVKAKRDNIHYSSATGDIFYVDPDLEKSDSQFIIYDPDLSNKASNQKTFETVNVFGNNRDRQRPTMMVNLYMLDGARIDDTMLKKGFYTMEHFLGKKYQQNNGIDLQTTSYDGLNLYDLTYFNEHIIPLANYYKYCNGDLKNLSGAGIMKEILDEGKTTMEFQRNDSSLSVHDRRTGATSTSGEKICSRGTSGLRVNRNFVSSSNITPNGSLKFKYGFVLGNGTPTTNKAPQNCKNKNNSKQTCEAEKINKAKDTSKADDEYTAFFEPEIADGGYAYIKLPHIGLIGNKKLVFGQVISNETDAKDFFENKYVDIYQLVKVSLGARNPVDETTATSELKEKNNYLLDGFDPTDKGWYSSTNHGNTAGTQEYESLFGGSKIGGTGQGNIYVPLARNASLYNISTPGYVSSDFGNHSKMNARSKSIALTASQGYIETETSPKRNSTYGSSFAITSYGSVNLAGVIEDSDILVLRNFDADSKAERNSSKGLYDGNISLKTSIIYKDVNPIKEITYDKSLDGFFQDYNVTNQTNCSNVGFKDKDTYAVYGNGETINNIVKSCDGDDSKNRDIQVLSANAKSNGDGIQQSLKGLVNDSADIKKETNFIISTLFNNVNDTNSSGSPNYNQINTTSNYLENITNNLDCSISISKAFNSDKTKYIGWLNGRENITSNTDYDYHDDEKVFRGSSSDPFGGNNLLLHYHFPDKAYDLSGDLADFYTGNSSRSVWLLGDKGVITYTCKSIEPDHQLGLLVISNNIQNTSNAKPKSGEPKFSHGNTIIAFNKDKEDKIKDYYGFDGSDYSVGASERGSGNGLIVKQDYAFGSNGGKVTIFYDPYDGNTSKDIVAMNTNDAINKAHKAPRGGIVFNVVEKTDPDSYGKVGAFLIDFSTGQVVASNYALLEVKENQKPLEYTDATKNEQQLPSGYNSSEVGFDGTTYGMNFTITNTKAINAEYPSGATSGGTNMILLSGYDYANQHKTSFPIFDKIDTTCSADTEYICDDGTKTQQDTNKLFDIVTNDGTIKIIETKNGTKTEHIAVSGSGPENGKYVFKKTSDILAIFLPKDKNYYEANTSYTIEFSVPKGKFVGAGLGENLTSADKDALTIVPSLVYYDTKAHYWDVGTSNLESNQLFNNFYYRWKVFTPSSNACLQELTSGSRGQYISGNGYHIYLSEEGAKNNGKSCSDADVKCLLSFEGIATDSNLHNSISSPYSGLNELSDGDMEIGKRYDLLVKMIANGQTSAQSNGDLKELDIIKYPLEMNIDFDYVGNLSVDKGLFFQAKNRISNYPMGMTENTSLSSKSFNSSDTYGDKLNVYDTSSSSWKIANIEDTRPTSLNGLKYYNTSLPTIHNKDSNKLYSRSSNGDGTQDEDRTSYYGVYAKITGGGKPKANLTVNFGTENVPDALKNQSCNFTVEFPEIEACQVSGPEVSRFEISAGKVDDYDADNINDFMHATNSIADDLNSCGSGNGDDESFSIEREYYKYDNNNDPTGGLVVNFRIENDSSCGSGDFSIADGTDLTVKVHITNRSRDIKKCVANIGTSMKFSGDDIVIEGVELEAGKHKNVEIQCAFNERDASCSEDPHEVTVEVSNTYGSDDDGTGTFKKCMLPTLKLEDDAEVSDGNSDNDKDPDVYSTAYPFEFKECNENIRNEWRIEYEGGCGVTDPGFKDFKIVWEAGQNFDDKGAGRQFIRNLSGYTIKGVTPTKSGNTLTWDFNNADLNDILDTTLRPEIKIDPILEDQIRLEGSKFKLIINRTDIIKSELDPDTDNRKTGTGRYESRELSSAIGLNPVIGNEKIYDLGIYTNPDIHKVKIHRNEINETSKRNALNGDNHREPVIYEVKVENPSRNNFYSLNELKFDVKLNSKEDSIEDVDTTRPNVGDNIVRTGWENQTVMAGGDQNFKGYFLLDPTLRSKADPDYGTVENTLNHDEGVPSLDIEGAACEYKEPFHKWQIDILENPLVINSIKIKDDSPTPDGGNQHLPGDVLNFKIELTNHNNKMDFENTFVELELDGNDAITDANLKLDDLGKIFEFVGGPAGHTDPIYNQPLYDLNGGTESCAFVPKTATNGPKIICYINAKIPKESTYVANINMLIKINTDFYNKLKASTVDEKYWYPVIIKEVRYGTKTLDNVSHPTDGNIIYYGSYYDMIPAGDMMGDVIVDDINDPANTVIAAEPDDGKYNFYIGMPYMEIDTRVINSSIGHFSPGDIIEFRTKAWSKSKSYIKNPKIIQKLFKDQVMDFVDVEVLNLSYTADKTNFNTMNKVINVHDLNTDTDPTNDISSKNITDIRLNNDITGNNDILVHSNYMDFYTDGPVAAYYEGVADPSTETGGEVEITSKIKIVKLKKIKRPQIGCGISETIGCVRGVDEGTNPKEDWNEGIIDLDSVGTIEDEKDAEKYEVYFPILKSILFQQQNDSYIPTPGSNMIRGVINDPNTEVVYRVDNFIPSEYDAAGTGVGKARKPMSFIRLPVGVRYTEGSAVVIENLNDNAPYGNEVAIGDPITTTKTEYEDEVDDGTSTYEGDLDNEDPDGDLLPTPEEIIEEENGRCLYGDGEYGFCILQL